MNTCVEQFLRNFEGIKKSGKDWLVCCPAHGDTNPSLSVSQGTDGRVLLHCYTGCAPQAIVAALGLKMTDLFPHDDGYIPPRTVKRELKRIVIPPPPAPDPVWLDTAVRCYDDGQRLGKLDWLADHLHVSVDALRDLRIGWHADRHCYAIPERNGLNQVCGIALRFLDDKKGYMTGGNRGLVIPESFFRRPPQRLHAVEGMSDCAALLTKGSAAVARASCSHGAKELHHLLIDRPQIMLTIVADRDAVGCEGAASVQATLQASLRREDIEFRKPPGDFKDMRAALIGGAL